MNTGCSTDFSLGHSDPASGLTLIELLISIALTGIITMSVYGSFRMISQTEAAVSPLLTGYSQMATCLDRISHDMQSMMVRPAAGLPEKLPESEKTDPFRMIFTGKADSKNGYPVLSFLSSASLPIHSASRREPVRITYYVDTTSASTPVLRRLQQEYPYPPAELTGENPILCETIREIQWKFLDETGQTHENWKPDSDDWKGKTPVAIEIRLSLGSTGDHPLVAGNTRIPILSSSFFHHQDPSPDNTVHQASLHAARSF